MSQSGISDKKQRGMGGTIKCAPFSIHTKPKMKRWAKRLDRRSFRESDPEVRRLMNMEQSMKDILVSRDGR